ncbi:MAG: YlxR family protein [Blautia sp.]|nr:YlxR family protein [Blautia sp.]
MKTTKSKTTRNKIPMRQCTGCREMKSKKEMIRVLKTTDDQIVLDTTGKQNGRGAYLCFSRDCLEKAMKNHSLERSLKTTVPDDVYRRLEKEMEEIEKQ